jgi:hypothetical protein
MVFHPSHLVFELMVCRAVEGDVKAGGAAAHLLGMVLGKPAGLGRENAVHGLECIKLTMIPSVGRQLPTALHGVCYPALL